MKGKKLLEKLFSGEKDDIPNMNVTVLTIEKREGLLGKLFPEKKFLREKLKFDKLREDAKENILAYMDYRKRADNFLYKNPIYSNTMNISARDKATEVLEPIMMVLYAEYNSKMVIGRLNFPGIFGKWLNFEMKFMGLAHTLDGI